MLTTGVALEISCDVQTLSVTCNDKILQDEDEHAAIEFIRLDLVVEGIPMGEGGGRAAILIDEEHAGECLWQLCSVRIPWKLIHSREGRDVHLRIALLAWDASFAWHPRSEFENPSMDYQHQRAVLGPYAAMTVRLRRQSQAECAAADNSDTSNRQKTSVQSSSSSTHEQLPLRKGPSDHTHGCAEFICRMHNAENVSAPWKFFFSEQGGDQPDLKDLEGQVVDSQSNFFTEFVRNHSEVVLIDGVL
jgi:hypothetical protein